MEKLKALVVDDSAVYRKIVSTAAESTGLATVENTASNGILALERLKNNKYDVVLLDVNMPEMDGLETLMNIKKSFNRIPVIMISGIGGNNAAVTLKALEAGAMDFIVKPLEEDYEKNMEIVKNYLKVLFAQIMIKGANNYKVPEAMPKTSLYKQEKSGITGADIVLVASSTGGPVALEKVFDGFGRDFTKPVLIVQHMPPDFTRVLAESLDKKSNMSFVEGKDGDVIRAGRGIIAPGGLHMIVERKASACIRLIKSEYINGVRPSADALFKSVAEEYKGLRVLAVILTGMGSDGMEGVRELKKKCSCYCITQSEQSCVVYGMPRSVYEAGLSDESLDLNDIAHRIVQIVKHGS